MAIMIWLFLCLIAGAAAHSQLIYPKPRNAIDSLLPEWQNGKAPAATHWHPHGDRPCACRNDTEFCDAGQTCLWFTVGTSIGCKEPDGVASNPNYMGDRCNSGMNATVNNPLYRTINRDAVAFSEEDWTRWNPWRAPGSAPVWDPCGMAGGGPHQTGGEGVYATTKFAKLGDLGSKLPKMPTGAVWKRGSTVEAKWSLRANHGGGVRATSRTLQPWPLFLFLSNKCLSARAQIHMLLVCVAFAGVGSISTGFARRSRT